MAVRHSHFVIRLLFRVVSCGPSRKSSRALVGDGQRAECLLPADGRKIVPLVLRDVHLLPIAAHDAFADLRRLLAPARLFVGIERFLYADVAARAMPAYETVEQAAVPLAAVAVAIARLLIKHFLHAPRHHIGVENKL